MKLFQIFFSAKANESFEMQKIENGLLKNKFDFIERKFSDGRQWKITSPDKMSLFALIFFLQKSSKSLPYVTDQLDKTDELFPSNINS